MRVFMDVERWDRLEAYIAELVVGRSNTLEAAVSHICRIDPELEAEVLLLAVISFATHLDHYLSTDEENTLRASHHRYRVIAALSADVVLLDPKARTCRALGAFWAQTDSTVFTHPKSGRSLS